MQNSEEEARFEGDDAADVRTDRQTGGTDSGRVYGQLTLCLWLPDELLAEQRRAG